MKRINYFLMFSICLFLYQCKNATATQPKKNCAFFKDINKDSLLQSFKQMEIIFHDTEPGFSTVLNHPEVMRQMLTIYDLESANQEPCSYSGGLYFTDLQDQPNLSIDFAFKDCRKIQITYLNERCICSFSEAGYEYLTGFFKGVSVQKPSE